MSKLTSLLAQVEALDGSLASDLREQVNRLSKLREFGLNFEQHVPETVELCGRVVRRGDKVRKLPERTEAAPSRDKATYRVQKIAGSGKKRVATLVLSDGSDAGEHLADDLVVVADFRDPIYPGLKSTGTVNEGGDKPYHAVINSENFHALEALVYTHEGKIDCIYIDPPYNTRDKDWKYNNDYVDGDDKYKHSKWLSMLDRRLKLAKKLLNPADSILIFTIDEKEYLRAGLLLEQVFTGCQIQMVTSVISPQGSPRGQMFKRSDEYLYFVFVGDSSIQPLSLGPEWGASTGTTVRGSIHWASLKRTGTNAARADREQMFYPVFLTGLGNQFHSVGEYVPLGVDRTSVTPPKGTVAVWPIRRDGSEGRWQVNAAGLRTLFSKGYARLGRPNGADTAIAYLKRGEIAKITSGEYEVIGRKEDGSVITADDQDGAGDAAFRPTTVWDLPSHSAGHHGSTVLNKLIPGRKFPFPKSLYAVEDALRFVVANKPEALVVDFFAGSGTTAHAVARLNKQDGGSRRSILVTNNEVSNDEAKRLRERGLRPGDTEWEASGICEYITKPRIKAAITGETPDARPISGEYGFTDLFPMADGFEENVEFFDLTYEDADHVRMDMAFAAIAPLLWLMAGARGRRIDAPTQSFDIADTYGVLFDLDAASDYIAALESASGVSHAFIVADDEVQFQAIAGQLPEHLEPHRLYESYLSSFEINTDEG